MPLLKDIPGVLISPEDTDLLEVNFTPEKSGYLMHVQIVRLKRHRIALHALIALRKYGRAGERDQSIVVDFRDRDRRNFQRNNIRLISGHANAYNNARLDHCGVTWNAAKERWRTRVTMDGRTVYLGHYLEEEDAWSAVNEFKQSPEFQIWLARLFVDLGDEKKPTAREVDPTFFAHLDRINSIAGPA